MEIRTVRFDDGTEVTVVRDGDRIYIDDKSVKKQSNRHVMSEHSMYMHNVVVREDADSDSPSRSKEECKEIYWGDRVIPVVHATLLECYDDLEQIKETEEE